VCISPSCRCWNWSCDWMNYGSKNCEKNLTQNCWNLNGSTNYGTKKRNWTNSNDSNSNGMKMNGWSLNGNWKLSCLTNCGWNSNANLNYGWNWNATSLIPNCCWNYGCCLNGWTNCENWSLSHPPPFLLSIMESQHLS